MDNNLIEFLEQFDDTKLGFETLNVKQLIDAGIDIISELKKYDMFKNVKKINVIPLPIYHGHLITGEPIENVKDYLGETPKVYHVLTYNFKVEDSILEFNDEIDLYSLSLSPKIYSPLNLECGVWFYPRLYSPINFSPLNKIEIVYSLEEIKEVKKLNDEEAKTEAKRIILEKVSKLIDENESNIPHTRSILIRCSERSVKKTQNKEFSQFKI